MVGIKSKFAAFSAIAVTITIGGCSVTVPVAVIGDNGEIMRGSATGNMVGDSTFEAANERARCSGTYDARPAETVSFALRCTDGRTGIGRAIRDNPTSGSGTITMSDGTTARFMFGPSARGF